jgi:hypothetical protein
VRLGRALGRGLAAGAAGTTALDAVTYLDMAVHGRPASSTPEDTVEILTAKLRLAVPGDDDTRKNRLVGLGALTGIIAGLGVGATLGLVTTVGLRPNLVVAGIVTGAGAMTLSDGLMTVLGVTDPRTWTAKDWRSDAVPHLAYGLVTAAVVQALDRRG